MEPNDETIETPRKKMKYPQFEMTNETHLHYKVIDFIRKYYPHAILVPGLGELQYTPRTRADAWGKGYKGGQPDLMILNNHLNFKGLVIEFKTPAGTGKLSDNQIEFLDSLLENGFITMVSNDYDEIVFALINYFKDLRFKCRFCCKQFKTNEEREAHHKLIHKKELI